MNKPDGTKLPTHIETHRLLLRPYRHTDTTEMFDYLQEPESYRFLEGPGTLLTKEQIAEVISGHIETVSDSRCVWAITSEDSLIGAISIKLEKEQRIAAIGYHISKAMWGQGYASEAGQAVVDAAFGAYPQLQRVQAGIHPDNVGSIRVAQRIGMEHEGTLRRFAFIRDEPADEEVYAVLRKT